MNKCILIYDDDKEILFLCKTILQGTDYRVETLSRCNDILGEVRKVQPDIILMDLWIPATGGEEAIRILKSENNTAAIPVLLFSANADIKEISKRIKAADYIEKPFEISTFKKKIADNLGRRGA